MPETEKAELIEGVVYMGSPVSAEEHSEPDGLVHTWLGFYAAHTPAVRFFPNATLILDSNNTVQPDACLCLKLGAGGRCKLTPRKYLAGAPEFIAEIAATSASIDLHGKREVYARNGVSEYLVWRTLENRLDWFALHNEDYLRLAPDRHGLLHSKIFPGLFLDAAALLKMDAARVLAILARGLASAAHSRFVSGN
jgi:Uma2 family endonuclease